MKRKVLRNNMKRELKKWQKETGVSSRILKRACGKLGATLHNKVCLAFDASELMRYSNSVRQDNKRNN